MRLWDDPNARAVLYVVALLGALLFAWYEDQRSGGA